MDETLELKPRRVGELFAAALDVYGKSWARLMAISAIVMVPMTILQYFLWDVVRGAGPPNFDGGIARGDFWQAAAASALLGILGIFIYQVLVGAVARSAAGHLFGRETTIREAYRYGYAQLWSILLVSVLVGLAVTGAFILLVIPGFFVLTRLIVSVPALVVEGKKGRAALRRSWELVTGYGWKVFGTIVLMGLITGLVSGVFAVATDQGWLGQALAAAIGSVVTGPFVALVLTLVYLDLRVRKEQPTVTVVLEEFEAAGS
jgi:hypothetical protein